MKRSSLLLIIALLILGACSSRRESIGKPCEVMVTGEETKAVMVVDNLLTLSFIDALPKNERSFDVVTLTGKKANKVRYERCIVRVKTDSSHKGKTMITSKTNQWAQPQLVVNIIATSAAQLEKEKNNWGTKLIKMLEQFERRQYIREIEKKNEKEMTLITEKVTGHKLLIPNGMTAFKKGKDFLWISNNTATGMKNICCYVYRDTTLNAKTLIEKRDSMMQTYIHGEKKDSYMKTERQLNLIAKNITVNGQQRLEVRGLWYMKGDAMGGPFICHAICKKEEKKVVVAEGFIYAPETRKRELIKQLEAVLYTLN